MLTEAEKARAENGMDTWLSFDRKQAVKPSEPEDAEPEDDGPDDPAEARRMEMTARLKIGAAKTKDELLGLVNRVQLKFDSGELPKAAVERLLKLADERRRAIPGD
jgi:hypothetical protein